MKDFLRTISEPLASARIESGDTKRRDWVLAELKSPSPDQPFLHANHGLVSIPNDDPEKLVDQLFDPKTMGRNASLINQWLIFLAGLKGTALGDKIYAGIQTHRSALSTDAQVQLLDTALSGGSLKALPEFPKLLHNLMSADQDVANFPGELHRTLEQHFAAEDLTKLASRIGVDKVTPARSLKAWDWLAVNTNQLTFDQTTHRFRIADAK
jgi:hypothetical protein